MHAFAPSKNYLFFIGQTVPVFPVKIHCTISRFISKIHCTCSVFKYRVHFILFYMHAFAPSKNYFLNSNMASMATSGNCQRTTTGFLKVAAGLIAIDVGAARFWPNRCARNIQSSARRHAKSHWVSSLRWRPVDQRSRRNRIVFMARITKTPAFFRPSCGLFKIEVKFTALTLRVQWSRTVVNVDSSRGSKSCMLHRQDLLDNKKENLNK